MSDVMVHDLADWLATQLTITVGTNLFYGDFPEDVPAAGATAICLKESGGPGRAGYGFADDYAVQLIVRGARSAYDYAAVRARAETAWKLFFAESDRRGRLNTNLSANWRVLLMRPVQTPLDLGVNPETQRRSVVFNLQIKAVRRTPAGA